MPQIIEKALVCHAIDTVANWQNADPLLLKGQLIGVIDGTKRRLKFGDGANTFNTTPYIDDFLQSYSIDAALPATNPGAPSGGRVWETSTPGTYTNFKNAQNVAIVVNSGEYVRIIDNGSYYQKVVIPINLVGVATEADLQSVVDAVFEPFVTGATDDTHGKDIKNYLVSVPIPARYYFDPQLPVDVTRLNEIVINNSFSGPGTISVQLIQINNLGVVTVIETRAGSTNGPGQDRVDVSDWRTLHPSGIYFIGLKGSGTTNPVRINNTQSVGKITADYTGSAVVNVLADTELNVWYNLTDERGLQSQLSAPDKAVLQLSSFAAGSSGIYASPTDSVLIVGSATSRIVYLPDFGAPIGKVYTIKNNGTGTIQVRGLYGSTKFDGNANVNITTANEAASFAFDGLNYYRI